MAVQIKDILSGVRNFAQQVMLNKNDPAKLHSLGEEIVKLVEHTEQELAVSTQVDMRVGAPQPNDPPGFQRIFEAVPGSEKPVEAISAHAATEPKHVASPVANQPELQKELDERAKAAAAGNLVTSPQQVANEKATVQPSAPAVHIHQPKPQ